MFVEIIIDIYLQMISKYFISDQEPAAEKRCVNIWRKIEIDIYDRILFELWIWISKCTMKIYCRKSFGVVLKENLYQRHCTIVSMCG